MPFIFLTESANSATDLFFKSTEVSPPCLDGSSLRAGITEVKEPGITSPTSSDVESDKGECRRCIA